jgi:membrane associated rhomboid family serine protease
MLEDRDYMRQPAYEPGLSLTAKLTIVMVVVFALQCINDAYLHTDAESWLALTYDGLCHGWAWQLLTFQFLHLNLMHLIMNLISFWWLGHFAENMLGKKRFMLALFGCGIVGGLLQGMLMLIFPGVYGLSVVGASAGVSGLLAIFALVEKDTEVRFYMILPMPAKTLLWIWGGISLFFTVVPTSFRGGGMAHAAHLGGLLAGIAWVKLGWHRDYVKLPWDQWAERLADRRSRSKSVKSGQPAAAGLSDRPAAVAGQAESSSEEVDAVLDKISARGINSLTSRERAILEAARKKMAQH